MPPGTNLGENLLTTGIYVKQKDVETGYPVEGEIVGVLHKTKSQTSYVVREAGVKSVVNDLREVPVDEMHKDWLMKTDDEESAGEKGSPEGMEEVYEPIPLE
jgi:hypothetical protein